MTHPYWPLFDLEVRTPRLTMRAITDELAVELAALAARGIHDPAIMPFAMPWTRRESPDLERQALQFYSGPALSRRAAAGRNRPCSPASSPLTAVLVW